MKKLSVIAIATFLLFANAFTNGYEPILEKSEKSSIEVYSVHELEIKPGVDPNEFETFIMNELAPIYNKMKGQKFILVKGDRGMRTGKYAIILTFESVKDRDRIYPPSGELVGDFGGKDIWDKFSSMISTGLGEVHTDYIKVTQL